MGKRRDSVNPNVNPNGLDSVNPNAIDGVMEIPCPHCGKMIKPGALLGGVKSERKMAAARKRGEEMRKGWANYRKLMGEASVAVSKPVREVVAVRDAEAWQDDSVGESGAPVGESEPVATALCGVEGAPLVPLAPADKRAVFEELKRGLS